VVSLGDLPQKNFQRILLIKPSAVGDVIHTIPVLPRLRKRYPNAQIDWLLTPALAELIGHHPALSNVVLFDRSTLARFGRSSAATRDLFRFLRTVRRAEYDLAIDLHGQFRSAAISLISRAPVRIGFDRPRRAARAGDRHLVKQAYRHGWTGAREGAWIAYTHRIPIPNLDVHAVDRYLSLGSLLGLEDGPPDFHIPLPQEAISRVTELLACNGVRDRHYVVLVPGTMWETKQWLPENFAAVGRHLAATGQRVVLAGSRNELTHCRGVAAACPGALDLCGQTNLAELAALLQGAALCVTNDSGSMHLAVAVRTAVVSIFGPTDHVWIGPYGQPGGVVRAEGLTCAPCYLRRLRSCPHDHACMKEVTPAMVIDRVRVLESCSSRNAS
jgi:lipopolysaccharide heptosyltransferase I